MDKKWREQKENIFIERVVVVVAVVDVLIQNFKLVTIEHANEFNLVGSWDTFIICFRLFNAVDRKYLLNLLMTGFEPRKPPLHQLSHNHCPKIGHFWWQNV